MGSPIKEKGRDAEFQHEVEITRPFYMATCETTVGQFRAFVKASKYKTDAEKNGKGGQGFEETEGRGWLPKFNWRNTGFAQTDQHPVVNVSWDDAMAFCRWASQKTGKTVDLPTEAEWEYACRAGTKTRFSPGDSEKSLEGYANVADESLKTNKGYREMFQAIGDEFAPFDDKHALTSPVATFKPNNWDLYDMHGNVSEWCKDWFGEAYYRQSPKKDPQGSEKGTLKCVRGGSWEAPPSESGSARRGSLPPEFCSYSLGFRVVVR